MGKFAKKLSAIVLCTVFASMQVSAATMTGDIGLGNGLGGSNITGSTGGFLGADLGTNAAGKNTANLNFNGNAHVNWGSLNVNAGEDLNFNAVNGANGLTVVNSVNGAMSKIYGNINSNDGITKLIISNPNGMLFDGAKFTTAGDLQLTTQAVDATGNFDPTVNGGAIIINDSNFAVSGVGGFQIIAPAMNIVKSNITAKRGGLTLKTNDGQTYVATGEDLGNLAITTPGSRLETVSVDGNVYILAGKDITKIVNGSDIKGDLDVKSNGSVVLNHVNGGKVLNVSGDLKVDSTGELKLYKDNGDNTLTNLGSPVYLRNANVGGNVEMKNTGGFVEVANVKTGAYVDADGNLVTTNSDGNMVLTTQAGANTDVKHFVHVVGNNDVKGNLTIDSLNNIHIGGYNETLDAMADGSLKVGGNLDAKADFGTVAVTIDTSAKNVKLTSNQLNVITDGKATISADAYEFSAKHYIGGVSDTNKIIYTMEKYLPIASAADIVDPNPYVNYVPKDAKTYLNIAGGNVDKVYTETPGYAYIRANNNMKVDNVDAGNVNLSAGQDIEIADNVKADEINVDGETRNLTVKLPNRNYTLNYTNIKDTEVITINPDTEITYEMANGDNGWNKGTQTAQNTYLVVPGQPPVDPDPQPPVDPDPQPPVDPDPQPPVNPDPKQPQDNDNVKILNNLQRDQINAAIDANQVYTPVAYAADLDDEIDTNVRKNVDGSVTVVRAFTPSK